VRNAEVIRQWKILKRIEAGRYTASTDLAAEHGVTERTIRRDIEALQEAGFPLYDERADGRKIWRLVDGYKQRLTQTFTLSELSALYFGKNLMTFLGGAPFAQELESAFVKIQEALPVRSLPYLARIQELFLARPDPWKDYSKKQDTIAAIIDAILHQRQTRVAYFSFNSRKTKTYNLDPYRLVYFRGGLYL
jgi:predicted DNA-binding transcriptional regulator YafY